MEQIQLLYGLPQEIVNVIRILYKIKIKQFFTHPMMTLTFSI